MSGPVRAKVYIVEDHTLMRHMLRDTLEALSDLEVCGAAATAEEALDALEGLDVDMVLIDMSLPRMSGAGLIEALESVRPGLRCLILSGHKEPGYVERALAAGARGYVLKGDPFELQRAIEEVLAGERYLSEPLRTE